MDGIKSLASKMAKVMQEVQYIQKTGYNSFHKYKYATEADVNEKVREALVAQNIAMFASMKSHSIREHKNRQGNTEYIVCVDMDFTLVDGDTGEERTISMSGEGQDAGDKGIYKAISGAQKYALMKTFMIPTGDDPEADEGVDERNHASSNQSQRGKSAGKPTNKPADKQASKPDKPLEGTASEAQVKAIYALSKKNNVDESYWKAEYRVDSLSDLSKQQASKIISQLQKAG